MSVFDTRPKFAVHVAQTDETFPCAGNESLLSGMVKLGRKGIPVGCVNGGCGVCKVRILDGEIRALGPVSRAHVSVDEACQGYTLACRVAPITPVHLEVAGKLNKPFSKGRAGSATASPSSQQQ